MKENSIEEEWKDIKDYEGLYQISNFGRVKSLERINKNNRKVRERILKQSKDNMGYYMVGLSKYGKEKTRTIHRLVAETFINNPNGYNYINHIDCNKTNNKVENLEWCTQKYNVQEAFRNNLQKVYRGKDSTSSKKVGQYDLKDNLIKIWDCTMDIQRELGFKNNNISSNCLGKKPTAYGYKWRYLDE